MWRARKDKGKGKQVDTDAQGDQNPRLTYHCKSRKCGWSDFEASCPKCSWRLGYSVEAELDEECKAQLDAEHQAQRAAEVSNWMETIAPPKESPKPAGKERYIPSWEKTPQAQQGHLSYQAAPSYAPDDTPTGPSLERPVLSSEAQGSGEREHRPRSNARPRTSYGPGTSRRDREGEGSGRRGGGESSTRQGLPANGQGLGRREDRPRSDRRPTSHRPGTSRRGDEGERSGRRGEGESSKRKPWR